MTVIKFTDCMKDYVLLDRINHYEFGFALVEDEGNAAILLLAIDHEAYLVRTIFKTTSLECAFDMALSHIRKGFYVNGLLFTGIPDYSLMDCLELERV